MVSINGPNDKPLFENGENGENIHKKMNKSKKYYKTNKDTEEELTSSQGEKTTSKVKSKNINRKYYGFESPLYLNTQKYQNRLKNEKKIINRNPIKKYNSITADLKNGMYIMFNGKPCVVVYFQHVKPGKGPAFVKTKLRNLENGRILENTFTAGVKLDTITVERRPYQYLYDDGEAFNLMHEETYEQITLPHDVVENADLMKEGQRVEMMFLTDPEERCLTCELPTYVTLEVTYSEPAVKGNTASTSALKEVTLETGAKIMVPLFIETGEIITVNTTDRSYGQRVK